MSGYSHLDLDLLFERHGSDGYRIRVTQSPVGQVPAVSFQVPVNALELENFILKIGQFGTGTRRVDNPPIEGARRLGSKLFDAVFHDALRECLHRSLDNARHHSAGGLRIRLRLGECTELAVLPWEFLYDTGDQAFLALSDQTPVVRYLDLPEAPRPITVTLPLRILVVISSPDDDERAQLDVEAEQQKIDQALHRLIEQDAVVVSYVDGGGLGELQDAMLGERFHILHFIGHGGFTEQSGGVLIFTDRRGRSQRVSSEQLGVLLHDHTSLRLVVLNACEGARSDPTDQFSSVAETLVRRGIPAVVAMQFAISDQSAILFATAFYKALAAGYSIDTATAAGRKRIFTTSPVEWATPVLYLRTSDPHLFTLTTAPEPVHGLYKQALAAEDSADWDTAIRTYQEVIAIATDYRDTVARRDACRRARDITNLQEELRRHAAAQRWEDVLTVNDQLAALDPNAADPQLAATARDQIARHHQAEQRRQQIQSLQQELRWHAAAQRWEDVLTVNDQLAALDPRAADPQLAVTARDRIARQHAKLRRLRARARSRGGLVWTAVVLVAVAVVAVVIAVTRSRTLIPQSAAIPDATLVVARTVNGVADLFLVDSATGHIDQRLTTDAGPVDQPTDVKSPWPVISPDRKSIVYIIQHSDAESSIRVMAANGTGDRDLFTTPTGCQRYLPPAWDPVHQDQLGLACLTVDPMQFAMRIVKLDGTVVHDFTINNAWVDDLSFSPDGRTLAYFSGTFGDPGGSIFTVPADGSAGPINLTHATTDRQPMWSPYGNEIVFSRVKSDKENHTIFVMSADGSHQRAIGESNADDFDPAWSPDGKTIAFRSNRDQDDPSVFGYFLMDSNGDKVRPLSPSDRAPATAQPAWGRR